MDLSDIIASQSDQKSQMREEISHRVNVDLLTLENAELKERLAEQAKSTQSMTAMQENVQMDVKNLSQQMSEMQKKMSIMMSNDEMLKYELRESMEDHEARVERHANFYKRQLDEDNAKYMEPLKGQVDALSNQVELLRKGVVFTAVLLAIDLLLKFVALF